jgi:hypothetical protein
VRAIKTTTISILALGLVAGSAVGVAAQDDETAAGAVSFTGTAFGVPGGPDVETTETDLGNGFIALDGFTYRNTWESSDERLTGDLTGVVNQVVNPSASATGGLPDIIMSIAIELTNDGGSWLGEGTGFGSTDLDFVKEMYTLVGQGGYEGLTAYVIAETTGREPALSGIIFPTAMPEAPEPYAGE